MSGMSFALSNRSKDDEIFWALADWYTSQCDHHAGALRPFLIPGRIKEQEE
jgi:hypothetical protein